METFPPEEQTLAMAVWGMGMMVAPLLGPTVGGYITLNWNWRWNFYINVPIGIAAAFMVTTFVHDPSYLRRLKGAGRADWLGIVCLVLSLGLGEIVMDRGERADWFATPWVWYFTIVAGAAFVTLIYHELRTAEPIVQLRLLKIKNFSLPTTLLITLIFTSYGMQILNPIFLQDLLRYTSWQAGLLMMPRGLGLTAAMFFLGGIARRGYDTRPLVAFGFILVGIGLWLLGGLNLNMAVWNFVWPTVIQGIGMGPVFPNLSAAALSSIPREQMGYATSLFSMTRNVFASVGTSVLTTLLVRQQQIQQSYLVEHVSVFDAWRLSQEAVRMPGASHFNLDQLIGGPRQGLAIIYGVVQGQAMMMSLNQIYRMLSGVMVIGFVLCFLLPHPRRSTSAAAAH